MLEFAGDPTSGRYIERSGRATERGSWRLLGNAIELESESGTRTYDLRLFENGSIGIDGPGRERQNLRASAQQRGAAAQASVIFRD